MRFYYFANFEIVILERFKIEKEGCDRYEILFVIRVIWLHVSLKNWWDVTITGLKFNELFFHKSYPY